MVPTLRQSLLAKVFGTNFLLIFSTGAVMVDEQTYTFDHRGVAATFGLTL